MAYAAVALTGYSVSAIPQEKAEIIIDGDVPLPCQWSLVELENLPHTDLIVQSDSGSEKYRGVELGRLLKLCNVPLRENLHGKGAAKYLHAEGRDGFAAVFALAEFDRESFLVADELNGAKLPPGIGPLRLIAPNDLRHRRWVQQLALLRIKRSAK
jgi:DMSO/TMAO reductase YedYZ molybdopterin-dependent catalytic subunit